MGEYARYRGDRVKIGTCEDMMYLRFDQRVMVQALEGNVNPISDELSIRFRFPFPDEDDVEPSQFENHDRGWPVAGYTVPADWMGDQPQIGDVQIVQQKVVMVPSETEGQPDRKELWTVVRVPDGSTHGHLMRLPLYEAAGMVEFLIAEASELIHGAPESIKHGEFLVKVAARVLAGYKAVPQVIAELA